MAENAFEQLVRRTTFREELSALSNLPPAALGRIVQVLQASGESGREPSTADFERLAQDSSIARPVLERAFAVSGYLGTALADGTFSWEDVEAFLVSIGTEDEINVENLRLHLTALRDASSAIVSIQQRRRALARGGRTVNAVSIACDLRIVGRPQDFERHTDVESYRPVPDALMAVAIVNVSFAATDDGPDCSFQLTLDELRGVILQLRAAERQLSAAVEHISISPE